MSVVTACTDDDDGGGGGGTGRIRCTVSVEPMSVRYEVGDAGQMLTLAPGTADEAVLERVAGAGDKIYGAWLLGDAMQDGVAIHGELRVAPPGQAAIANRCSAHGKSVTAIATTSATITDTVFTILQPASDVKYLD